MTDINVDKALAHSQHDGMNAADTKRWDATIEGLEKAGLKKTAERMDDARADGKIEEDEATIIKFNLKNELKQLVEAAVEDYTYMKENSKTLSESEKEKLTATSEILRQQGYDNTADAIDETVKDGEITVTRAEAITVTAFYQDAPKIGGIDIANISAGDKASEERKEESAEGGTHA